MTKCRPHGVGAAGNGFGAHHGSCFSVYQGQFQKHFRVAYECAAPKACSETDDTHLGHVGLHDQGRPCFGIGCIHAHRAIFPGLDQGRQRCFPAGLEIVGVVSLDLLDGRKIGVSRVAVPAKSLRYLRRRCHSQAKKAVSTPASGNTSARPPPLTNTSRVPFSPQAKGEMTLTFCMKSGMA